MKVTKGALVKEREGEDTKESKVTGHPHAAGWTLTHWETQRPDLEGIKSPDLYEVGLGQSSLD